MDEINQWSIWQGIEASFFGIPDSVLANDEFNFGVRLNILNETSEDRRRIIAARLIEPDTENWKITLYTLFNNCDNRQTRTRNFDQQSLLRLFNSGTIEEEFGANNLRIAKPGMYEVHFRVRQSPADLALMGWEGSKPYTTLEIRAPVVKL